MQCNALLAQSGGVWGNVGRNLLKAPYSHPPAVRPLSKCCKNTSAVKWAKSGGKFYNVKCSPEWVKSGILNWSCSGRLKAFRDVRDGNACVQFGIWPPPCCFRGVMMRMHLNWISIKFHPRLVLNVQLGSCILLLTKPHSMQVISTLSVGVLHFNK